MNVSIKLLFGLNTPPDGSFGSGNVHEGGEHAQNNGRPHRGANSAATPLSCTCPENKSMKRAIATTLTLVLIGSLMFAGFVGTAAAGDTNEQHNYNDGSGDNYQSNTNSQAGAFDSSNYQSNYNTEGDDKNVQTNDNTQSSFTGAHSNTQMNENTEADKNEQTNENTQSSVFGSHSNTQGNLNHDAHENTQTNWASSSAFAENLENHQENIND